jgi:ABC-type transport system involved in multi-copper enzyme maturation permease subunit
MARELRAAFVRGLAFALVLELMLVAAILYFPSFEQNVSSLRAMAPLKALKQIVDELEQGGVFAYVAGQHFFKGCNTLGTAAAVLFGAPAVAGEAQRGTLEIWLARPVSRARLLGERFVLGALALVLPVLATSASIPWLLPLVDEQGELEPYLLAAVHQSAVLLALYGAAFLWSSASSHPQRIAFVLLFFTTFEFALYLIDQVTRYSLYRLSDIKDLVRIESQRSLDWWTVLPLLAFSAACFGLALVVFRRRVP